MSEMSSDSELDFGGMELVKEEYDFKQFRDVL
jgi:hypothetical protein